MEINETYIEEILTKILSQSENGKVEIGNENTVRWIYYVRLFNENTKRSNRGEVAVKIQNRKKLIKSLKEYLILAKEFYQKDKDYYELSEADFHEKLILNLLVNTTNFDLNNIENYVKQRIAMLKEEMDCSSVVLGEYMGSELCVSIVKNVANLEGPYKFQIKFSNMDETYYLPSVTFGRIDDEVFIYCLQGSKGKQTNALAKKLDRHFRKANKGVDMEDEILSQVSVSALVALTIFLAYQKAYGVKKVSAYNFMPIRYETTCRTKMLKLNDKISKRKFLEEHDRNQFNISNKFFYTLIRYAHHFGIDYDYDDICEKLEFELKNNNIDLDNIIYDIEQVVLDGLEKGTNPTI